MKIDFNHEIKDSDRMYCPSTGEVIFAYDSDEINYGAKALIAYWHGNVLDEPFITDAELSEAWETFYEKWNNEERSVDLWEAVEQFLKDYQNDEWIVIECIFSGIACGPSSTNVYHVVYKDTVIEEDPDYVEEEYDDEDDDQ